MSRLRQEPGPLRREPGAAAPQGMESVTDDRELWDMAIMHNLSLSKVRAAEVCPSILTLSRRRLILAL
jgi:hypothetical protein